MICYGRGFVLFFWAHLFAGGRGDLPQTRQNSLSTHIKIGIKVPSFPAAQNTGTPKPGTEQGFIETPLPWPHPTYTSPAPTPQGNTTTLPGSSSTTTIAPTSQRSTNPKTASNSSSATTFPTPTSYGNTTVATSATASNTSSWTIEPVGCYRDSYVKPRPLPELITDFRDTMDRKDINKIIRACAEKAREKGFKVFGIQFYTACWSGPGAETTYPRDGVSVDCNSGVGKSGANFVYKFGDYEMPGCPPCKEPRHLCFPANSRVTLESGENIIMRQLRIGDKVRTLGMNGETADSKVIAFLHRAEKIKAEFYKFETSGGNALILSPQHLIFRKENSRRPISAVFASEIKLGNLLYTSNGSASEYKAVTRISMVTEIGVYAPLTMQGTLLVDGILVSCYATWPSHDVAHLAMAPLRAAYTITGAWNLIDRTFWSHYQQRDGISWYALALMALTNTFL